MNLKCLLQSVFLVFLLSYVNTVWATNDIVKIAEGIGYGLEDIADVLTDYCIDIGNITDEIDKIYNTSKPEIEEADTTGLITMMETGFRAIAEMIDELYECVETCERELQENLEGGQYSLMTQAFALAEYLSTQYDLTELDIMLTNLTDSIYEQNIDVVGWSTDCFFRNPERVITASKDIQEVVLEDLDSTNEEQKLAKEMRRDLKDNGKKIIAIALDFVNGADKTYTGLNDEIEDIRSIIEWGEA